MMTLDEIKTPVKKDIEIFDRKFKDSLKGSFPLLDKITTYIVKTRGKQLRPMFVFFSADIIGGINESTYTAASLVEMLHTATLIHDDIVDDANIRRGFMSVKAIWKNKIAVLIGDYLLSRGLLLAIKNEEFTLLKIVSDAVREMSEGELLQIQKSRTIDITEEIYFDIIRKKTASLIASCCACGAASAKADKLTIEMMYRIGENIGIAFQIKDDLLDYDKTDITGKTNNKDIKDHKITLPLIYALDKSSYLDKKKYNYYLRNHNNDNKKIQEIVNHIIKTGGIEYAKEKMNLYKNEALNEIKLLPHRPSRYSLEQLVNYVTERKK